MAVPVVGRCCWAVLRALGTAQLGADPWRDGDALAALRRDAELDHGAPASGTVGGQAQQSGTAAEA
eukprot:8239047-Alexandrium_andersonii.AAC.1